MKTFSSILFFALVLVFVSGCSEKTSKCDFQIQDENPASALTIGWYVSPEIVKEIVGNDFTPKIVNDKNETSVMLFIVASEEHIVDEQASGKMGAAHLIVPVENVEDIIPKGKQKVNNMLVCPITIVEGSQILGNKYNDFGFPTYSGEIKLDIKNTDEKYMVDASIKTVNGLIEITAMFEEDPVQQELSSAIFTSKSGVKKYFFGNERFNRISNGKGNLKTGGQNIISAMNMNNRPYYLKLDTDISWEFNFSGN